MMVPVKDGEKKEAAENKLVCTPLLPIRPKPFTINFSNSCFALQPCSSSGPTILIPLHQQLTNSGAFTLLPANIQIQPTMASTITSTATPPTPLVTPAIKSKEIIPNITELEKYVAGTEADIPQLWCFKEEEPCTPQDCVDLSQFVAMKSSTDASLDSEALCPEPDSLLFASENSRKRKRSMNPEIAAKIANADVKTILDIVVQQNQVFWCEHCDIYFPTYSTYILHKGCHSSEEPFQCHFCGAVFLDKHEFLAHFMQCAHD